jgi:hypothetical protein
MSQVNLKPTGRCSQDCWAIRKRCAELNIAHCDNFDRELKQIVIGEEPNEYVDFLCIDPDDECKQLQSWESAE